MRLIAALLLATATVPALAETPSATDAPSRAFTGSDLFQLSIAADPQISPDGRTIVYVRRSGDVMTDRMKSSLWLIDVASGRQTPFAASGSGPRWSPDGTRIAYVAADGASGTQLFVRYLSGGAASAVTSMPDSPNGLSWSPDGRRLAYVANVTGEATHLGKAPPKPEGAKWAKPLEVIDRITYRADGGGYIKPERSHLFVVSADGGGARQLTFGPFDDGGPLSWSKDGQSILFSAIRGPDADRQVMNSEVIAVDVASGNLRTLTTRDGPDYAAAFSPDGSRIAWLGFDDHRRSYENTQLYIGGRAAEAPRSLTGSLDRAIEDIAWADGNNLYASYDDRGQRRIAKIGLDGRLSPIIENVAGGGLDRPYTGGDFSVSRNGVIAYTGGDASAPADVWVWSGGKARRLTSLNANLLEGKALASVRKIAVKAPDGRAIDAWLATPPGRQPGQKVPLILEIHGGPNSAYSPGFATDMQLYAAAGYAVLWTNPRGSTSYGAEFANLIDKNYPSADYDDLMAAVDAAIADGTADPENLFVTGGSGGGVLTAWIVGKTDRFKAAATQKPVINWISEALTMDGTLFTSRYWFSKMPWEDPMGYWKRSPLSLVGNVKTPTLVVVGSEDYRTPVSESEQYYAALQIRGVPTALVKVPGASHGGIASRPSQSAAKASAIIAWFDRYRTGAAK
ncbi:MAG: S9 family peptidase [Sphingomonas bacterium]